MQPQNIENTVDDEANHCTHVVRAPRVLSDGEIYKAIRREILRRGGKPLAHGETLTMTATSSGGIIASAAEPDHKSDRRAWLCLIPMNGTFQLPWFTRINLNG